MVRKTLLMLVVVAIVGVGAIAYRQVFGASGTDLPRKPSATAVAAFTPSARATATTAATAPQAVRVELSEQEVTQLLRDRLRERGYKVDDLTIHLEDGRFTATTTQQISIIRVPVTIVGEAAMVDGQLSVQPTSVSAGGAPIPQEAIDQLSTTFRTELAAGIDSLPVRPLNVQLKPGKLLVDGVPK